MSGVSGKQAGRQTVRMRDGRASKRTSKPTTIVRSRFGCPSRESSI